MADYGTIINQAAATSGGLLNQDLDRISRERVANRQIGVNSKYTQGLLDAQGRQTDLSAQKQQYEQWKDIYASSLDTVMKTATELRANGKSPAEIMSALTPATNMLAKYEQQAGEIGLPIQPGQASAQLQAILNAPTAIEAATTAGTAKGKGIGAAATAAAESVGPYAALPAVTGVAQLALQADPYGGVFDPVRNTYSVSPEVAKSRQDIAAAGKQTNITNVNRGLPAETFEKLVTDRQVAIQKHAAGLRDMADKARNVNALLGDLGGGFDPWFAKAQAFAQSLGFDPGLIDPKKLGPVQAGEAIGKLLALGNRNTEDGAGMPGAMSDADRKFLVESAPTLAMTPSGRQLLQKMYELSAKRAEAMVKAGAQAVDMELNRASRGEPVGIAGYQTTLDAIRNDPQNNVFVGNEEIEKLAAAAKSEYFSARTKIESAATTTSTTTTDSVDDAARKALGITK